MSGSPDLLGRARETALWAGAVLGVICLLLGTASVLFDVRPLVFRSGSMAPDIRTGALALAQQVPTDEVRRHDVVSVVDRRGVRVTHRVVAVDRVDGATTLRLKGDANAAPDAQAYAPERVYRVFFDVPRLGYVVSALSSPWGLLGCGAFVMLLLVTAFGRRGRSGPPDPGGEDAARHDHDPDGGGSSRLRTNSLLLVGGLTGAILTTQAVPTLSLAAFSDTSTVAGGSLTAANLTPGNPSCSASLFRFLEVRWNHSHVANRDYRVVITRATNNEVVLTYPWQAAPATVGQQMLQEVRATGNPSVGENGDYWATVESRMQTSGGWTGVAPRVAIRRTLGLMYCGH